MLLRRLNFQISLYYYMNLVL